MQQAGGAVMDTLDGNVKAATKVGKTVASGALQTGKAATSVAGQATVRSDRESSR